MKKEFEKYDVKITVVKKTFNEDLLEECALDPKVWSICSHFNVGDEFMVDKIKPWEMPVGFCGWAWNDIHKLVLAMARGGFDLFLTCCTDGYRPVLFRLEKIKEETL